MAPAKELTRGLKRGQSLDDLEHLVIDDEAEYKRTLKQTQLRLLNYQRALSESKRTLMVIFEGPDAAGKGGAIKRFVERLDPRLLRVHSIVKPTQDEYSYHYLWRFWAKIPKYGHSAVFDRSWYGRVLVERVEGFATEKEWRRAYQEINDVERTLADDGAVIVKIYMHISKEEQLARFKRREANPYKHWKVTEEDWRNRRKWKQHNEAAHEMFERTSTAWAPWQVVAGNFKWHARLQVTKTILAALEQTELRKQA